MTHYRELTESEISVLTGNANRSEDWKTVTVDEGFIPEGITGCTFSGQVRLGVNNSTLRSPGGIERKCVLRNTEFINCTLGNNVYISNTGSYIANYTIEDNVYIEDCGVIETTGPTSFGNGVITAPVNEVGGREVPLYRRLSSQLAYITAMYRHRVGVIGKIYELIEKHTSAVKSETGRIARGTIIAGCGSITNVNIGPDCKLLGTAALSNGTLEESVFVGHAVKAYDFIMAHGAHVNNHSVLRRCFIGEACSMDFGFSAVDSLFFANSDCANGEACSVFAGPFTVTHHKSTLLIAGIFSFFNAGSGSNQSNHLFKTGPVHQGVHQRGTKFASDAYIMLPARNGAFSVVMGRHTSHHDTENFPFSYLMDVEGKSYLMPGANIRSYGPVRDTEKWPRRDRRKGPLRDRINFEAFNPYLGEKILKAIEVSEALLDKDGVDTYTYERVKIKQTMLKRGLGLYKTALSATFGVTLSEGKFVEEAPRWADLSGMFAPMHKVEELLCFIEKQAGSTGEIEDKFDQIRAQYTDYAYSWAVGTLEKQLGHKPSQEEIASVRAQGLKDLETLRNLALEDAQKDNDALMSTSYGIDADGCKEIVAADFAAIRKSN